MTSLQSDGVDHRAQVLQATDIVELIGQTVKLKRQGRNFIGLCPFHSEKSPSFSVDPTKQFFYCFGCKAGGNAIDFVIKRDRVEFRDALRQLAGPAGIDLPQFERGGANASERQAILDANSAACAFFQSALSQPEGKAARDYIENRGFNSESVKRFQVGVALPGWELLVNGAVGRKFGMETLLKAGLAKQREGSDGCYDTFRNRLMFPIRDDQGRVIAFGGRVMPGSEDPAKYLNSPETPLFSKSRCLFGLDLARQRIVETRTAVVVEGYTDVMMPHQFGITNVVSPLGTALTSQHVALVRRYADRLVLLFDPDLAGDLAVNRAVELFLTQPIEVLIATLPEKLDPDEYLLEHGAEAFQKVIDQAQDALSYKWKQLERQYRAHDGDLTGQQKAVEQYLQTLGDARGSGPVDSLRWGSAVTRVGRLTGIPVEELNRRFRMKKPTIARHVAVASPESTPQTDGDSSSQPQPEDEPVAARGPANAQLRAERQILGCLLNAPKWWHEVQKHVHVEDFLDTANRKLAEVYWDYQKNEGEPVFAELLNLLQERNLARHAIELLQETEALTDISATVTPAVEYLQYARDHRESATLRSQLGRVADGGVDDANAVELLRRLTEKVKLPDMRRGT